MLDDMVRDMFVEERGGGEVVKALDMGKVEGSGGIGEEEEAREFTIAALPSPTRELGVGLGGKVVLELDAMSPLLREMQKIERVGSAEGDARDIEAGAVEIGPQATQGAREGSEAKRVPSLIQYFQDQAALEDAKERAAVPPSVGTASDVATDSPTVGEAIKMAVRTVTSKVAEKVAETVAVGNTKGNHHGNNKGSWGKSKPPLLPVHQGQQSASLELLEVLGLRETFDHVVSMVAKATQGRRKMLAVIALSYLVLLHVFLISGRL